uniref:Uncharacterized protein n=1 Tax=Arundo donax TaxID=35708 RepID=A0A0A8Z2F7_ARUDO
MSLKLCGKGLKICDILSVRHVWSLVPLINVTVCMVVNASTKVLNVLSLREGMPHNK